MIESPLPTLPAWVKALADAEIPVLPHTVAELRQLREIRAQHVQLALSERLADGPVTRTNPIMAGQQLHVQSGGDASWTTHFRSLPMPSRRTIRST